MHNNQHYNYNDAKRKSGKIKSVKAHPKKRHKFLITVISVLNKLQRASKTMLIKTLFLLKMEYQLKYYNFYPYKFGPFSSLCYRDLNFLVASGIITENLKITDKGQNYILNETKMLDAIFDCVNRFKGKKEILDYVYTYYPVYSIKSSLNKQNKVGTSGGGFYSIGYEGKDIDEFLDTLLNNQIRYLIDIRKLAFSFKFSFSKSKLKSLLQKVDIKYLHLSQLGVPKYIRNQLRMTGDYQNFFKYYQKEILEKNKPIIENILNLGRVKKIALMCFEANVNHCHRHLLCKYLENFAEVKYL